MRRGRLRRAEEWSGVVRSRGPREAGDAAQGGGTARRGGERKAIMGLGKAAPGGAEAA